MLELFLALSYLRTPGVSRFFAVFALIGIALGVSALIVVTSVMNGFQSELLKQLLGINGHLTIADFDRRLPNYSKISKIVNSLDEVDLAIPFIDGQVVVSSRYSTKGVIAKAISKPDMMKYKFISAKIKEGNIEEDGIIIGNELAKELQTNVGDEVNMILASSVDDEILPIVIKYKVVAIFSLGMYEYDSSLIYFPLKDGKKFMMDNTDMVNGIEVYLKDVSNTDKMLKEIVQLTDTPVHSWKERQKHYVNALNMEKRVMFLILTIIIVVSMFNVISSLSMLIQDKEQDIAILRTIGMRYRSVLFIFLFYGICIGTAAILIGVSVGALLVSNLNSIRKNIEQLTDIQIFDNVVYFFKDIPVHLDTSEVLFVVFMSFFLCVLSSIYPAIVAARKDPATILRYG